MSFSRRPVVTVAFVALLAVATLGGAALFATQPITDTDAGTAAAYNVSTATPEGNVSVTSETVVPSGVTWNDDGTTMYVADDDNYRVLQYSVSEAYNVSTASYETSYNVSSQSTSITGVEWGNGGAKLYTVGVENNYVYEYDASTAYDVTSLTFVQSYNVTGQTSAPHDVTFNETGDRMFVSSTLGDGVYQYSLSTAWDVSTASFDQSTDISGSVSQARGVEWGAAGDKVFFADFGNENIAEYDAGTPYNISSLTLNRTLDVSSEDTGPSGLAWKPDGERLYMSGTSNDNIYQYNTSWNGSTTSSSTDTSADVAGTVVDQNGQPAEHVQVEIKGIDTDTPASQYTNISGRNVKEIWDADAPEEFLDQVDALEGFTAEEFSVDAESFDATVALMHTEGDWEAEDVPEDYYVTDALYDSTPPSNVRPRPVVPTSSDGSASVLFACWTPAETGALARVTQDSVDASIPGMETGGCDAVEITQVYSSGETWSEARTKPVRSFIETEYAPGLTAKEHAVAKVTLTEGIYRVKPAGAPDSRAITYAVAPDGDPSKIADTVDSQDAQDAANRSADEFEWVRTTTDANGEFAVNFSSDSIDRAEITAYESGTNLSVDNPSRSDVVTDFESEVESSFNAEVETGVSLSEADQETLRDACSEMESVFDAAGVPYFGATETSVPTQNATVDGYRLALPKTDQAVLDCAEISIADAILNGNLASILPSFLDDGRLEERFRMLQRLLLANSDLLERVDEESNTDIETLVDQDPATIDQSTLETAVNDGFGEVDEGPVAPMPGDGPGSQSPFQDGGPSPSNPLGGGGNPPTTSPPDTGTDAGDETLEAVWQVGNVDDWSDAALIIRLDYSNGSTRTLSKDSEYVTVDETTVGTDVVRLSGYPLGTDQPATVDPSIDIVTPDGVSSDPDTGDDQVTNPTFDGAIPGLQHVTVSSVTPQAGSNLTISATPERDTNWGGLQRVEVTGPGCTRNVSATNDEATVQLCNSSGDHTIEAVVTNPGGVEFTETLTLEAFDTTRSRPPTVRTMSGPTGRYAVAAGLDGADISVANGGEQVDVTAIAEPGDVPSSIAAHTTGMSVPESADIRVRVVEGDSRQTVRERVGVVIHTTAPSDDAIYYRNGDPVPYGETAPTGHLRGRNDQLVYDTFTNNEGEVTVTISENPSLIERAWHRIQLTIPDSVPVLSAAPTVGTSSVGVAA